MRAHNKIRKRTIREANEDTIMEAAEAVFAEFGYGGASTRLIAERAGIPKANLHYYFQTKEELYRRVLNRIFLIWLDAASAFDNCDDPVQGLTGYIHAKMDLARSHPMGSKIWANEIIRGAPVIQDYLETRLREWTEDRVAIIERWIAAGKMRPIEPYFFLYMIWATTQHYADFGHQIKTLNGGNDLDEGQWQAAKNMVADVILVGIGARRS